MAYTRARADWVDYTGNAGTDTLIRAVDLDTIEAGIEATATVADTARLGRYAGVNAQTGTTYTLAASDEGKLVTCTNAAAITVTVDTNLPVGGSVDVVAMGAGMVTVVGSGVTVVATPSAVTRAQYSTVSVIRVDTTNVLVVGDLA